MTQYSVGKEVLSYCGKCKLTLAHIIASMKGPNEVDKVICKTCKGTHTFKDPSQTTKAKPTISRIARTKGKSGSSRKSSEPHSVVWERSVGASGANAQDYSIKTQFKAGDLINHPTFGQGIVERSIDANKIQVMFRDDSKVLLHNKK